MGRTQGDACHESAAVAEAMACSVGVRAYPVIMFSRTPALLAFALSSAASAAPGARHGADASTSSAAAAANAPSGDYRLLSVTALAGGYTALGTWAWVAWYDGEPTQPDWTFGGDGWFGADTYAGGADKLGHLWAGMALTRLGTELLRSGGWDRWPSSLIASGLSLTALTMVEVNDGYYTEFSPADSSANLLGATLGVAMGNWPALDDAIDFRVQWFPSADYRRSPSANVAEDYSGQTFVLAYKPRSIAALRDASPPLAALQFINPVLGFETRNYKPKPPAGSNAAREQNVFFGLTLDAQAVIDAAWPRPSSTAARWTRGIGHGVFEVFNLPYSTLPALTLSRTRPQPAD